MPELQELPTNFKIESVIIRAPGFFSSPGSWNDPGTLTSASSEAEAQDRLNSIQFDVLEATSSQLSSIVAMPDVLDAIPTMPFVQPAAVTSLSLGGSAASAVSGTGPSWGIDAINATGATESDGENTVVAILDTGIAPDHPAFSGVDLVRRNYTQEGEDDRDGHGTHAAGTIFGRDVDGRRIGVARGVKKALIAKVLGEGGGQTETVLQALHWVLANKATVINMSLGIDFVAHREKLKRQGFATPQATSLALAGYRQNIRVFDRFSSLLSVDESVFGGAFVAGATGNSSRRPDYTITVEPPAAGEHFCAVAALDGNLDVAPFSNTEPNLSGPGVGILSAALGGGLRVDSGTSMAAPHVAGAAVLWREQLMKAGNGNAKAIHNALNTSAKNLSGASSDVGLGLVQAP